MIPLIAFGEALVEILSRRLVNDIDIMAEGRAG